MPLAPLAAMSDVVLLIVRVVLGVVMVYYGWPKVKDPVLIAFGPGRISVDAVLFGT